MRFPPEPGPFTERVTIVGILSNGAQSTPPLDCLLDISQTGTHPIIGWVMGNKETAKKIEEVHGRGGPMRLQATDGSQTITSDKVWLRGTRYYGAGDEMPHGLLGIACEFDCVDFTRRIDFRTDRAATDSREVRFLLSGPREPWPVAWIHSRSYTGSSQVSVPNPRLATGGRLPFAISVVPHFLYARVPSNLGRREIGGEQQTPDEAETNVLALVCRTHKTPDTYDDVEFLKDAKRAAEDMCLLVSLLAGSMVVWYGFHQSSAGSTTQHMRSLFRRPELDRKHGEEIVFKSHVRDFLRTAFRRLRSLRESGIDLELPIVYAISGARQAVARQRFGELFLALEALHSIYLQHEGKTFLVEDKTFKRVKDRLEKPLLAALRAEGIRSRKLRRNMVDKLGGLNRPALWQGVQSLMKRLRVDWEDLYPEPVPAKPTFLRLRNSLFHSHKHANDDDVVKEAVRLEGVVHRIILRWLGWEDLWHAPSPWIRHFVAGKSLPDRHRLSGRAVRTRKRR
jgi:hypothetical protein